MATFENTKYYGILLAKEDEVFYARVNGEEEIRQAKIKDIKVTFSEGIPNATIRVNLAGEGKRWFKIEPQSNCKRYECDIHFYKTQEDAVLRQNEFLPYKSPNNLCHAFIIYFGEMFHMEDGWKNEIYRYAWDGDAPVKSFYSIPENETIIVNHDGWHFFNPWVNEKADAWFESTEEEAKDVYERIKSQIKVVTFEDEEDENLDEGNEMTCPIEDATKLTQDAINVIERILNYYNL